MSEAGELVHLLRNLPVSDLITALERDGFTLRRSTRTGGRIYMHEDGRLTVLEAVGWNLADAKRLGLIS
jgi:predicted RNA binding protein YcfA (HicA-like mRNA interferase family)